MKYIAVLMAALSLLIGCSKQPEELRQPFMNADTSCRAEGEIATRAIPWRFLYIIHGATGKVLWQSTVRGAIITSTRCIRVDAQKKEDIGPGGVGYFEKKYEYIADIRPGTREHSASWFTANNLLEIVDLHKGDLIHVSDIPLNIRHGIARLPKKRLKHR